MARISVDIIKEGKIVINDSTKFSEVPDEQLNSYTQKEGFTSADFKYTSTLIDADQQKREMFDEVFSKLMMEELIKAMNDTTAMNKMMRETK